MKSYNSTKTELDKITLPEENWKDYSSKYWVSDRGRIYSRGYGLLKPTLQHYGYYVVTLTHGSRNNREQKGVHQMVAEVFVPNPENKPQINHINGVKTDNRAVNLEWVTVAENVKHAFDHNLQPKERNKKTTIEDRAEMVKLYKSGLTFSEIAKRFNVNTETVRVHVRKTIPIPPKKKSKHLTNKQKSELIKLSESGKYMQKQLAEMFDISTTTVHRIIKKSRAS